MPTYARNVDGLVVELITPPEGFLIDDCFPASFVAQLSLVPDGVFPEEGWSATQTGDAWTYAAPPPYVPPPLTWDQELATRIAQGIAITSTATPALNATFALDETTMSQIGPLARDSAAGWKFPGGTTTFTYPALDGTPRTFNEAQFVALYLAQRDLIFALTTQAGVMARGGQPNWPPQSATIA